MPRITSTTIAEHRQVVSHRLLEVFGELLAAHGYEGLSLRDVSERAEVARTAIYNYYRDKPGMLLAWMRREMARFGDVLSSELAGCDDPAELLRRFVVTALTEFASRPISAATNVAAALPPDQREDFLHEIAPVRAVLVDILAAGSAAGVFHAGELDRTADMILACLETQRTALARGESPDHAVDRVLPFITRGLSGR